MLAILAGGCSTSPDIYLLAKYGKDIGISGFDVCKNYGCKARVRVAFNESEWGQVREIFARERVREAVALMERIVGPKAGTAGDGPGAPIINIDTEGQLDCIDEAYNTTTYLRLIAAGGFLQRHDVGEPHQRGGFITGWPHNTATVIERETKTAYTVDSWFHANGEMPEVVLLSEWLSGWSPPEA
jgi:hypothetical protein